MLKSGGYLTYLVGKWHLGFATWAMTPVRRGFGYFYGMYGGFAHYFSHMSAEPAGPGVYFVMVLIATLLEYTFCLFIMVLVINRVITHLSLYYITCWYIFDKLSVLGNTLYMYI